MAKQSSIDKIIKELEAEISIHKREMDLKGQLVARLQMQRPFRKAKPKPVKVIEDRSA